MTVTAFADWANGNPLYLGAAAVLAAVLVAVLRKLRRAQDRPPVAVVTAAIAALLCTAYSGDTSWRFARDHLGMASGKERIFMFAAAEVALFAMAMMARQNLHTLGAPGTPGVLIWVVTGVQVIPAYSETGLTAGTVRAFFGPVCSALLWHLAMGIELRHGENGQESQSLPAVLVRELRERMLSRLGLAERGRDAEQITRDRWTRIATDRAARLAALEEAGGAKGRTLTRARRRLAVAVDRTDAGVLPAQRAVLLDRLAAHRNSSLLASMALPSPWESAAVPVAASVELLRIPEPAEYEKYAYSELPAGDLQGQAEPVAPTAIEAPPTPAEVQPEYDPEPQEVHEEEHEPADDSPLPPGLDNLTARARADFLAVLVDGGVPSIRALKDRYGVGQDRATRIQGELKLGSP